MKWRASDRIIARFRYSQALGFIKRLGSDRCQVLVDIGCGTDGTFLRVAKPYIGKGYGCDRAIPSEGIADADGIELAHIGDIEGGLPFQDGFADCITMLAVLEHISKPETIIKECRRVLRPGGFLILTVPTWQAKPILEFLAFRLGVISRDEILDHKRYYSKGELSQMCESVFGEGRCKARYFELGVNLFAVVKRET